MNYVGLDHLALCRQQLSQGRKDIQHKKKPLIKDLITMKGVLLRTQSKAASSSIFQRSRQISSKAGLKALSFESYISFVNFPGKLLKSAYNKWENVFGHSLAFRLLKYLTDNMHLIIGLILIVIMAVPYHIWRNEYGAMLRRRLAALFLHRADDKQGKRCCGDAPTIDYSILLFFVSLAVAASTSLLPAGEPENTWYIISLHSYSSW